MQNFTVNPIKPKPFTLVFPHIPKTGGTTLLYHFRKNLGDNNILSYGQHNRVVRFFNDQYQLEELSQVDVQRLRIVQGHGVDQNIFSLLPEQRVKLLVVLRNPIGLTKSRFNHQANSLEKIGKPMDTDVFVQQNPGNFMSNLLMDKFPQFVDDSAVTDLEKIISILQKFEYVYTTEQLDSQSEGVLDELSVPYGLERRRVASSKRVFERSDIEIEQANAIDMELFKIANQKIDHPETHNPFGFDRDSRDFALDRIAKGEPSQDQKVQLLYERMASFMATNLRAESALAKLDTGSKIALNNPKKFRNLLETAWSKRLPRLTEQQAKISKDFLAKFKANNKRKFFGVL